MRSLRLTYSGLLLVSVCGLVRAQDSRGQVQGVVTDSTQGVVIGAKVVLSNNNTGVSTVKQSGNNGHYLFDYVNPGVYTITVEMPGFARFVQQNVQVQVRGDVTVDASLKPGGVTETVTVTEAPPMIQFNTSTMEQTVDSKMLHSMPTVARNPFALALLDPAVTNGYASSVLLPFNKWQTSAYNVGGGASGSSNDLLLDGAPIQVANAGSYVPTMDAVQEFSVQQNSVDAEYGQSAGGIMNLSMKSGTNEVHGTAYYFGRNPKLNARTNSVTNTANLTRNHIGGGTLGGPIIKNKLFTFGSYERWRMTEGNYALFTMPTALERDGDFSQSLNVDGNLRQIYDPASTQFNPSTGAVSRLPFAGNRIPTNRMDSVATMMMKDIWLPNNPGINRAGTNNFSTGYPRWFYFWNFSDRTDWNVNDKWKVFGRFSRYSHTRDPLNYANSPAAPINGYDVQSRNYAGDAVYTLTPATLLNFRVSYVYMLDALAGSSTEIGEGGLSKFWPNQWFKPYLTDVPIIFYPNLVFSGGSGNTSIGRSSAWNQRASTYTYHGRMSTQRGPHYLKAGFESRRHSSISYNPVQQLFTFNAALTADTFISPVTRLRGDPYATFLLGALDSSSKANYQPRPQVYINYYAGYLQDDYKLSRRVTLNLGLRYEYNTAKTERMNRIMRYLDLQNPIPEFQAAPPRMPAELAPYNPSPRWNGSFLYADAGHPAGYTTPKTIFLPRAGVAIRLDDKTALRFGYARYAMADDTQQETFTAPPMYGFDATTTVAPSLEGKPGALLSDPFPAANPIILPVGKKYWRYTQLGSSVTWTNQDYRPGINDRLNLSLQRQLPWQFAADVTYFVNLGHDFNYNRNMNMADPQLRYTYKAALSQSVNNPFYQYLTPDQIPGQLRNQSRIAISSLLTPYPQYTALQQNYTTGYSERYQALQMRLQRQFSGGSSLLLTYNYNREKAGAFFNDLDQYVDRFTYRPSDSARHRMVSAWTYDLPFGKGRPWLASSHPIVNAVLGGWSTSSILIVNSGRFLRFGQVQESGAPPVYRNRDKWFDTTKFAIAIPFTPRTNPYQYEGVTGPRNWNLDTALSKTFALTERFRLEFRMDAYNLTNTFVPTAPSTDPNSSTFGRSTNQANAGREMQYTLRLAF